jgi:hypothetical protein
VVGSSEPFTDGPFLVLGRRPGSQAEAGQPEHPPQQHRDRHHQNSQDELVLADGDPAGKPDRLLFQDEPHRLGLRGESQHHHRLQNQEDADGGHHLGQRGSVA